MGTTQGLRQVARRSLWLVLLLIPAALIAVWLLLPGANDARFIETEEVGSGDPAGSPGRETGDSVAAESPAADAPSSESASDPAATADSDRPTSSFDRGPAEPNPGIPEGVLEAYLALVDEILTDPDDAADVPLSQLATDSALQEVRSMALEFSVAGLRQTGRHEVVSMASSPLDGDEVSIEVCLDRSAVGLLHADGAPVLVEEGDPRSLHTYVLRPSEAGWQVAEHRFPEPNRC